MNDLKDLIAAKLDVHEFLDLLDIGFPELLDYLDELIEDNEDLLRKEVQ